MARMVLGVFTGRDQAEDAISELGDAGFKTKDISLIMKDSKVAEEMGHSTGASVAGGAASGATAGGVIGGLAGLGVPEEDAKVYEERVRDGAILLVVPTTSANEEDAMEILDASEADQVKSIGMDKPRARDEAEYGTPTYYSELRRDKRRKDVEEDLDDDLL